MYNQKKLVLHDAQLKTNPGLLFAKNQVIGTFIDPGNLHIYTSSYLQTKINELI